MELIRVLIVDDRPIFRAGARGMLSEYKHINVVGEAVNGREAVRMARSLKPDVILMDISMPEMDGISATEAILQDSHEVAILALSVSDHEDDVSSMLEAGACGYILKDSGPRTWPGRSRTPMRGASHSTGRLPARWCAGSPRPGRVHSSRRPRP